MIFCKRLVRRIYPSAAPGYLNTGGHSVDVPMRRFVLESEEKMLLRDLERIETPKPGSVRRHPARLPDNLIAVLASLLLVSVWGLPSRGQANGWP
jgi:hypothetical protein